VSTKNHYINRGMGRLESAGINRHRAGDERAIHVEIGVSSCQAVAQIPFRLV